MSKCNIYETLGTVSKLSASTNADTMTLEGVFGVCNKRNGNNRIYTIDNYTEMVNNLKEKIAESGCPGELEHPDTLNTNLGNISHKIDDINIDENGVVTGKITLLNTPKGKVAQEIVKSGLPLYISSRASGDIDANGVVTMNDLETYDLVGSPGFAEAKLHIAEGKIGKQITESLYIVKDKPEEANITEALEKQQDMIDSLRSEFDFELSKQYRRMDGSINSKINTVLESMDRMFVEKSCEDDKEQDPSNDLITELQEAVDSLVTECNENKQSCLDIQECIKKLNECGDERGTRLESLESQVADLAECLGDKVNSVDKKIKAVGESLQDTTHFAAESKFSNKALIDDIVESLQKIPVPGEAAPVPEGDQEPVLKPKLKHGSADVELSHEPLILQKCPAEYRSLYDALDPNAQQRILTKATFHIFNTEQDYTNFWNSIDFNSIQKPIECEETIDECKDSFVRELRLLNNRK